MQALIELSMGVFEAKAERGFLDSIDCDAAVESTVELASRKIQSIVGGAAARRGGRGGLGLLPEQGFGEFGEGGW